MPTTALTTGNTAAIFAPSQRGLFRAKGRDFLFFSNATDICYTSTMDSGVTWLAASNVRTCVNASYFSLWYDEANGYLHTALFLPLAGVGYLYYRRGQPCDDGNINWDAEDEVHSAISSATYYYPSITLDSGGYPWISCSWRQGTAAVVYIWKSSTNSGVWTTASGFPKYYDFGVGNDFPNVLVPLSNLKVLLITANVYATGSTNNTVLRSYLWSGAWGSAQTASTSRIQDVGYLSAVAEKDDVHVCFLSTGSNIIHVKRIATSASWSAETTVQASVLATSAPVLSMNRGMRTLYCFFTGSPTSDHVFFKKYHEGTWGSLCDWASETNIHTDCITTFNFALSYKVGVAWVAGLAAPYNLRFGFLAAAEGMALESVYTKSMCDIDLSHIDIYGDTPAHEDVTHIDGVPHTDSAHGDAGHWDGAHTENPHWDTYSETHWDTGPDYTPHGDEHLNAYSDYPHDDVAHADSDHQNVAHGDVTHSDTPHGDQTPSDPHEDVAYKSIRGHARQDGW